MEIYRDKTKSAAERAKNLLSLMTLDEKICQMHVMQDKQEDTEGVFEIYNQIRAGKKPRIFGGLFNLTPYSRKVVHCILDYALHGTRLGIPVLVMGEGLHGLSTSYGTRFPQNIGLGCSFDDRLIERMARRIGKEAYTAGYRQLFAPNIDVVRDLRWGRVQEDYSEDCLLAGKMGAAYVRGLQSQGVAATLKHYIGYSLPENGINLSSVHVGERDVREQFLPAYREGVKAGAKSVMLAYHDMDGVPLHASKKWCSDVLRGELGFDGVSISDWDAVQMLNWYDRVASTKLAAGKMAIDAELDIEAPGYFGYSKDFIEAIERGEIDVSLIDRAVERVLKLKFELGLFDGKDGVTHPARTLKKNKNSLKLAREAAEKSIVLLKNDGVLPLDKSKVKKVAVIGPSVKDPQLGGYVKYPFSDKSVISIYDGLCSHFGAENVLYARGSYYSLVTHEENQLIAEAVEKAKTADVVILSLGDNARSFSGVGWGDDVQVDDRILIGENYDTHDIRLPAAQRKLFNAVSATAKEAGKKLILTLYAGRPNVIVREFEKSDAVVQAWYPGDQGGYALADILCGSVNPTAKLGVSFPRSNGHQPCCYIHRKSARGNFWRQPGSLDKPGKDYVFSTPKAFLEFGYGLSYVPIRYDFVKVKKTGDFAAEVSVKLTNTGDKDAEEAVLLFTSCVFSNCVVVPYEKLLKAYKRVKIRAGKSRTVKFVLDRSAFSYVDEDMKTAYASGQYVFSAGNAYGTASVAADF